MDVRLPKLGEGAEGGAVVSILVKEGDTVTKGQTILELENESADPEQSLTLNLPADTTRFRVPARWIASGAEYQVGVATVARNGNVVFAEVEFTTAD